MKCFSLLSNLSTDITLGIEVRLGKVMLGKVKLGKVKLGKVR
jgi:hypothetical protein